MTIEHTALYQAAELALAAYFLQVEGQTSVANLGRAGLTETQAREFAKRYPLVRAAFDDQSVGGSGFQANVFEGQGKIVLAIRGTQIEEVDDLLTDSDIAFGGTGYDQIVAMVNWWNRMITPTNQYATQYRFATYPVDAIPEGAVVIRPGDVSSIVLEQVPETAPEEQKIRGLGKLSPTQQVDVVGHSLGAHLALAFSTIFSAQTGKVTVFNAPGFSNNFVNQAFFAKLGGSVPLSGAVPNITSVIADESSIGNKPFNAVAGWNSRPGAPVDIAIENQWQSDEPDPAPALNHSMTPLTDALAVYRLLAGMDAQLSAGDFKVILNRAAQGTAASYERTVDELEMLLRLDRELLDFGNLKREQLYKAIYGLVPLVDPLGGLNIDPTADDAETLVGQTGDIAYRYALSNLSPFVVLGDEALFAQHNLNGELALYDPATGAGALTTDWLQDRAAFLERKLYINQHDLDKFYQGTNSSTGEFPNAPDERGRAYQMEAKEFQDRQSRFVATTGGAADSLKHYIFGGWTTDIIIGAGQDDRLYGSGGVDVLRGGGANDRLEGGQGFDVYQFAPGDGEDTVLDVDGLGLLVRDKKAIPFAFKEGEGQWKLGTTTLTRGDGNKLEITFGGGSSDKITVENFDFAKAEDAGFLCIRLLEAQLYRNDKQLWLINSLSS